MVNILSMLKVGGHIYHSNPLVSLNHGFYNLNPTFYSDFYIDNGHKLVAPIYAIERNIENKEDKEKAENISDKMVDAGKHDPKHHHSKKETNK